MIKPYRKIANRMISALMALALAVTLVSPALADGEGPVTGSFTLEIAPVIESIEVLDQAMQAPESLTPGQEYRVRVTVSNQNGIGDLSYLQLKLWYDDSGARSETTQADFDIDGRYIYDGGTTRIQFQWDRPTGTIATQYAFFTLWEVHRGAMPIAEQMANPEFTRTTFEFLVKISKAAQETLPGSGNVWHVGAKAANSTGGTAYLYYGGATPGLPMNWYGEVYVAENTVVDWGIIPPGIRFDQARARQYVNKDVTYYCNGAHYQEIKASTSWPRQSGGDPALLSANAAAGNTFALKAFMGPNNEENAVLLDSSGNFVHLKEYINTGEYGAVVSGASRYNNLYIQLSPDIALGKFNGTITYGISNKLN